MRTMAIEDALIWAYRDELPKNPRPRGPMMPERGWAEVDAFGEVLTVIDEPVNRFGVVEDYLAQSAAHPDALAINEAVLRMDAEMDVIFPDDWSPISDLGDLGDLGTEAVRQALSKLKLAAAVRGRTLRWTPAVVVRRAAIFARDPEWDVFPPEVVLVKGAKGQPRWFREITVPDPNNDGATYTVEVDGFDRERRRPFEGAYQKQVLEPCPVAGIVDRAIYEIWRAAMDTLFSNLDGRLQAIRLTASRRPYRPWEGDEALPPQVLYAVGNQSALTRGQIETSGAA